MHERVRAEMELVREKFPDLQYGDQWEWVLIPKYPLPAGRFNKEQTKLLFNIPPGYPNTGPDNFFIDADLRLKDGSPPANFNPGSNSSSGPAAVSGDWAWFSWHPNHPTVPWRPAATIEGGDNLLTFLRSIKMCLRGEEG